MKERLRRYRWAGVIVALAGGLAIADNLLFGNILVVNAVWPISATSQNLGEHFTDVVTSPFGLRLDDSGHYDFHEGIDMRAALGAAFPLAVSF